MIPVSVTQGAGPVILAIPHAGTAVEPSALSRLNDEGKTLRDTDWHMHRLYAALLPGATTVKATFHRYVIDANRDPSGQSLYPGQNTTGLCPVTDFDGYAALSRRRGARRGRDRPAAGELPRRSITAGWQARSRA